jgi:two-component system sensor histidine kinase VicK
LGDAELLHQAIVNLLSNAVKYSPQGSEITLDARLEGKRAILSVKDRGIGIPRESLEKVFDMFYRVQITSKHHATGTGLGLALVKEIAETHKGQVWAESTLGQGSTFYISLPVVGNDQQ